MRAGNTPRTRPSCRKCERTLALALHPRPARRCIIQPRPAHFPKLAAEHLKRLAGWIGRLLFRCRDGSSVAADRRAAAIARTQGHPVRHAQAGGSVKHQAGTAFASQAGSPARSDAVSVVGWMRDSSGRLLWAL